jgi:type IV pilus assembly protein PilQ
VLDFSNTASRLKERSKQINVGITRSVYTVQAKDRTRVVVELATLVGYQTAIDGNELLLTLADSSAPSLAAARTAQIDSSITDSGLSVPRGPEFTNLAFRGDST